MPPEYRDVVYTYRYLRLAMIALLLMLVLSVGYQWWFETGHSCWLGSISAYYYTPARTVFVGSLCALGAALIVYKGHSPEEDVLLNFSGFMAFVVAMVPTVPDNLCGPNAFTQTPEEIAPAVSNNVWSLIVVAALAAVTAAILKRMEMKSNAGAAPNARAIWATVICSTVLLVELALFLVLPDRFIALSHGIAAGTMVAGVIAVMVMSALRVDDRHQGDSGALYRRIYLSLAVILGVLLGATVSIALTVPTFDHLILVAELVVIAVFIAYWIVQTVELWDRRASGQAESRQAVAVAQ